jgi:AcrR family transcriptional regulator
VEKVTRHMPNKKTDRRTQRTRQALISTFVKMLLERGYENFTVGDIADQANVGRSTLYAHYSGKKDLIKDCIGRPSAVLASIVGRDATPSTLAPLINHFAEQRELNGVFFKDPVRQIWIRSLAGLLEPKVVRLAREWRARPLLSTKLISQLLAEMQVMLITTVPKSEAVSEALIASSHALLTALLRLPAGTSTCEPPIS